MFLINSCTWNGYHQPGTQENHTHMKIMHQKIFKLFQGSGRWLGPFVYKCTSIEPVYCITRKLSKCVKLFMHVWIKIGLSSSWCSWLLCSSQNCFNLLVSMQHSVIIGLLLLLISCGNLSRHIIFTDFKYSMIYVCTIRLWPLLGPQCIQSLTYTASTT